MHWPTHMPSPVQGHNVSWDAGSTHLCNSRLTVSMVNFAKPWPLGFPKRWENHTYRTYVFHRFQQMGRHGLAKTFVSVFCMFFVEEIPPQPIGMMSCNQLHQMEFWFCPKTKVTTHEAPMVCVIVSHFIIFIHLPCVILGVYTTLSPCSYHHDIISNKSPAAGQAPSSASSKALKVDSQRMEMNVRCHRQSCGLLFTSGNQLSTSPHSVNFAGKWYQNNVLKYAGHLRIFHYTQPNTRPTARKSSSRPPVLGLHTQAPDWGRGGIFQGPKKTLRGSGSFWGDVCCFCLKLATMVLFLCHTWPWLLVILMIYDYN